MSLKLEHELDQCTNKPEPSQAHYAECRAAAEQLGLLGALSKSN